MRTIPLLLVALGCAHDGKPPTTGTTPSSSPSGNSPPSCLEVRKYAKGDPGVFPVWGEAVAEPQEGACNADPHLGLSTCKAVDDARFPRAESGGVIRPIYSRWRHDSVDGALYFLQKDGESPVDSGKGQLVVFDRTDNSTFATVDETYSGEAAEFRWSYDPTTPHRLYYVEECRLSRLDLDTGTTAVVHDFADDFPGCGRVLNDVEGDSSADSREWAFMVEAPYDGSEFPIMAIATYDLVSDAILGTLDVSAYRALGGSGPLPTPNMVDISPLGTHVLALWPRTDRQDAFDGPHVYGLDFSAPLKVCNNETHGGWAFDADGNEVYVCQVDNTNWDAAPADTIAWTSLTTGETQVALYNEDLGWEMGFHFGRFTDPSIRGWFSMSTHPEGDDVTWMTGMVAMVQLVPASEGPLVWRIADTHNDYPGPDGYSREAYAPVSGDGRMVLWGADWKGGDATVDTYRVDLPARWWDTVAATPTCED